MDSPPPSEKERPTSDPRTRPQVAARGQAQTGSFQEVWDGIPGDRKGEKAAALAVPGPGVWTQELMETRLSCLQPPGWTVL